MLEHYFFKMDTVDNIRASWLGEPIERYVTWLAEQDYSFRTITRRVPILKQFGEFAQLRGVLNWDELPAHVEPFVAHWVKLHAKNAQQAKLWVANNAQTPVDQLLSLILADHPGSRARRSVTTPFINQAPKFFQFLSEERGLKESSLYHYGHYLRTFEVYLKRIGLSKLKELSPAIVSAFIIDNNQFSKTTMTGLCSVLRVFLRYLHSEQLHQRDLSTIIESPRHYQLADVPRSISWDDVQSMLDAVDRRTQLGKRDYAILLLLITYGLRSYEVAALTLDHIDWKQERLMIPDRKAGHSTAYPLSLVVGEAILEYLKEGRPKTEERHVFYRTKAPRKPITAGCISSRTKYYLLKAGIHVHRPGSHTLRHSCVQRLVDANFPFKVIGDYVGHASPSSTAIYSKVDLEALREVAMGHGEALS
jgi:site-specific recombinase XerD